MNAGASGIGGNWLGSGLTLYFGIAIGLLLILGVVIILTRMRKIRRECRETLASRYGSEEILCHDNLAHFLGFDSLKGKQTRGQGVLVLARDELYFFKLHPRMELCIPLKRIKRVVTPKSFLDISSPLPLLQIHYQQEDGRSSSVAWKLRNLELFTNSLKQQRKKIQPKKRSR